MEQRISLITLGVADLARSRYFYEHGLGWQPSSASNEQVAFFQIGGMVLALYGKTALAQDAHLSHEGTGFGGIALAYNVRQREEVDAVLAEAQTAGHPFSHRLRRQTGVAMRAISLIPMAIPGKWHGIRIFRCSMMGASNFHREARRWAETLEACARDSRPSQTRMHDRPMMFPDLTRQTDHV